jgi:uncharacterized protein YkwD
MYVRCAKQINLFALISGVEVKRASYLFLGFILLTGLLPIGGASAQSGPVYLPLVYGSHCQKFPHVSADDLVREQGMANAINAERAAHGVSPVNLDSRLTQAARWHSRDMADNNFVSHDGSDDSAPWDRMEAACYDWTAAGEIIGAGYVTVNDMLQGWLNSPGHRAILLDPIYTDFGVGYAYNPSSTYKHYWTVDFGRD